MSAGGSADSIAPPALIALGLGCACAIGGFLGLGQVLGQWTTGSLEEDRQIRAEVRAVAATRGLEAPTPSRALTAFGLLGYVVAAAAMIGCYELGPLLPPDSTSPCPLILGVLVAFPALAAFSVAYTRTHELLTPRDARAYGYSIAAAATAGGPRSGYCPPCIWATSWSWSSSD